MSQAPMDRLLAPDHHTVQSGAEVVPLFPERDADRELRVLICAEVIRMDPARLAALGRWLEGQ